MIAKDDTLTTKQAALLASVVSVIMGTLFSFGFVLFYSSAAGGRLETRMMSVEKEQDRSTALVDQILQSNREIIANQNRIMFKLDDLMRKN